MRPLLEVLGATVLAALGSLLTPHGLDALRYPLTYVGRENASLQFVAEWRSPDFHQALFFPFAASLLLALALGLGGRPLRPIALLWSLTVAYMALQSVRHIPLYAIVVTPLLAARGGAEPLLATLRAYFDAGGNAAKAARALHLSVRAFTYRLERVKALTGHDPAVRDFVLERADTSAFLDRLEALLVAILPSYEAEGRSYLTVAIGCTGGRHRSVAIAEELSARLRSRGTAVRTTHRDVSR